MMTYFNISHDLKLIMFELYVWDAGIGMNMNVNCMQNSILSYCMCF